MNTKSKLATVFLSYVLFASCEKVIEVDLNSNDPQIVVEAEINDDTLLPAVVRLSKSLNYNQDIAYPAVSGAKVTITDNLGNSTTLTETKSGVYTSTGLIGKSGRTYNLSIFA
jgi:hypothetical protein